MSYGRSDAYRDREDDLRTENARLRDQNAALIATLKCIDAALNQPATFPADVDLARRTAVEASKLYR